MRKNDFLLVVDCPSIADYQFKDYDRGAFSKFRAVRAAYKPLPVTLYKEHMGKWYPRCRYLPGVWGWIKTNWPILKIWFFVTGPFFLTIALSNVK